MAKQIDIRSPTPKVSRCAPNTMDYTSRGSSDKALPFGRVMYSVELTESLSQVS